MEEVLLECGIVVSYETVRRWTLKFGPEYARRLMPRGRVAATFGIATRS
jgi:transposase-like protein